MDEEEDEEEDEEGDVLLVNGEYWFFLCRPIATGS